jgi:hypothetical protein
MTKTLLFVTAMSLLIPSLGYALDVDDCKAGSTVYLKGWTKDQEVTIIDRNNSDKTCQIRLGDGKTKWVEASALTGIIGKEVRGWAKEKIADGVVKCLFGDACSSKNDK